MSVVFKFGCGVLDESVEDDSRPVDRRGTNAAASGTSAARVLIRVLPVLVLGWVSLGTIAIVGDMLATLGTAAIVRAWLGGAVAAPVARLPAPPPLANKLINP